MSLKSVQMQKNDRISKFPTCQLFHHISFKTPRHVFDNSLFVLKTDSTYR